jgi:hypothetical protein
MAAKSPSPCSRAFWCHRCSVVTRNGRLASRHKLFLRILPIAFVIAAIGYVLVLAAGTNVNGLLAKVGASIGLLGVLLGFVAFIAYSIVLVHALLRGDHDVTDDEKSGD